MSAEIRQVPLLTNRQAVDRWGGHLVRFTIDNMRHVTAWEVLDPAPVPTGPYWETSSGALRLVIPQDAVPANNAVITVDVPAFTGGSYMPNNILGLSATSGVAQLTLDVGGAHYGCNIQDSAWSGVTNQQAIAWFVGQTLTITFGFNRNIKTLEIMGSRPAYPAATLTQMPNGFVELAIPRSEWTGSGTITVDVPVLSATLTHPEWRLGTAGTSALPRIKMFPATGDPQQDDLFLTADAYPTIITNQIAKDELAGHAVTLTVNGHSVTHIEVLP